MKISPFPLRKKREMWGMCKTQNLLINTTLASCQPDQQAWEQSRFKYQGCLICPSKWRNKATLPNYQHYKNTALLQIKHKGSSPSSELLRESASYFWAPLLPLWALFLIRRPSELGTRPPALIPIICTYLSQQARPAVLLHPQEAHVLCYCSDCKENKHENKEFSRVLPAWLQLATYSASLTYLALRKPSQLLSPRCCAKADPRPPWDIQPAELQLAPLQIAQRDFWIAGRG